MKLKKILSIGLNIIFYVLLALLIFVCVIMGKSKIEGKQPTVFGYKFYVVLTGSMKPTINPGDLIMDETVLADEVKAEDIITFKNKNTDGVTTHRVKDVINEGKQFKTKGDANNVEDMEAVSREDLQGKVVKVFSGVGTKVQFLQNNIVKIFVALGILIIITVIFSIFKVSKKIS